MGRDKLRTDTLLEDFAWEFAATLQLRLCSLSFQLQEVGVSLLVLCAGTPMQKLRPRNLDENPAYSKFMPHFAAGDICCVIVLAQKGSTLLCPPCACTLTGLELLVILPFPVKP